MSKTNTITERSLINISVSRDNYQKLKNIGRMGDSFDSVISKLLEQKGPSGDQTQQTAITGGTPTNNQSQLSGSRLIK